MPQQIAYFNYDIPNNYTSEMKHLMVADNKRQFTDDFKNTVSSFLGGVAININLTDSSTVAAYGNEWVICIILQKNLHCLIFNYIIINV